MRGCAADRSPYATNPALMKKATTRRLSRPSRRPVRIALVMIVRDEAESIARCLLSAKSAVDEMIVLDTGSTDATIAIARDLGAKVFEWAWRDDFAAARNEALSHSTADWNLILDADEWLVGDGQLLRQVAQREHLSGGGFLGLLQVKSLLDAQRGAAPIAAPDAADPPLLTLDVNVPGSEIYFSWLPRFFPRGIKYFGRIHEQPRSELPFQFRKLAVEIGHGGYLWAKLVQKKGRNRSLLLTALRDDPESPYLHYQLGKDYDIYGGFAEAITCYEKALHLVRPGHIYRIDMVVRTLACLKNVGQLELAYKFAEDEMQYCQKSPDFFFVLAYIMLKLAVQQPHRAREEWLPMARVSLLFALKIGDAPEIEGSVSGRGSSMAARDLAKLDLALARLNGVA
jgi:glycosyltransferase involved in cell wall biosynthesis